MEVVKEGLSGFPGVSLLIKIALMLRVYGARSIAKIADGPVTSYDFGVDTLSTPKGYPGPSSEASWIMARGCNTCGGMGRGKNSRTTKKAVLLTGSVLIKGGSCE